MLMTLKGIVEVKRQNEKCINLILSQRVNGMFDKAELQIWADSEKTFEVASKIVEGDGINALGSAFKDKNGNVKFGVKCFID